MATILPSGVGTLGVPVTLRSSPAATVAAPRTASSEEAGPTTREPAARLTNGESVSRARVPPHTEPSAYAPDTARDRRSGASTASAAPSSRTASRRVAATGAAS